MTTSDTPPVRREQPTGAFLGMAVAAAIVWGLASLPAITQGAQDAGGGLAMRLGGAAGAGMASLAIGTTVIWAILYFVFVQSRAPERGPAHFLIIGATMFAAQVVPVSFFVLTARQGGEDRVQSRIALESMKAELTKVAAADVEHPPVIDLRPKASGEAGVAEGVVKAYLNNTVHDRANYAAELKASGFMTVLAPRSLGADPGLARAKRAIAQARVIVAKYEALSAQRIEQTKQAIDASSLSATEKARFDEGVTANSSARDIWRLEMQEVDECGQTIDGLAHARGRWRADGKLLRFADDGDMNAYNQHVRTIKATAAQEEALRRSTLARVQANADATLAQLN